MKKVTVTFEAEVPCEATDEQVREWVRHAVGDGGGIANSNPLDHYDLETIHGTLRLDIREKS